MDISGNPGFIYKRGTWLGEGEKADVNWAALNVRCSGFSS